MCDDVPKKSTEEDGLKGHKQTGMGFPILESLRLRCHAVIDEWPALSGSAVSELILGARD